MDIWLLAVQLYEDGDDNCDQFVFLHATTIQLEILNEVTEEEMLHATQNQFLTPKTLRSESVMRSHLLSILFIFSRSHLHPFVNIMFLIYYYLLFIHYALDIS